MNATEIIDRYDETNEKIVQFMERVSMGIEALNHSNELHKQAIDVNTIATRDMVAAIRGIMSMFRWVMIVLVLAIVVLAGAEKVLHFLPSL